MSSEKQSKNMKDLSSEIESDIKKLEDKKLEKLKKIQEKQLQELKKLEKMKKEIKLDNQNIEKSESLPEENNNKLYKMVFDCLKLSLVVIVLYVLVSHPKVYDLLKSVIPILGDDSNSLISLGIKGFIFTFILVALMIVYHKFMKS